MSEEEVKQSMIRLTRALKRANEKDRPMSFKNDTVVPLFLLALYAFMVSLPLAWLTHVYVCLVAGKWGFLIAGALVFPIAIIHGYGVWFGLW